MIDKEVDRNKCPLCKKELSPEEKVKIEKIHGWIILPWYSEEQCVSSKNAIVRRCKECGYFRIIKRLKT
jgi:hypothetical protein